MIGDVHAAARPAALYLKYGPYYIFLAGTTRVRRAETRRRRRCSQPEQDYSQRAWDR